MTRRPRFFGAIQNPMDDYELLDSGDGRKLERFGKYVLARPCSQALWRPARSPADWSRADAAFDREDGNRWHGRSNLPKDWQIETAGLRFKLGGTDFGHLGIFPEQRAQWKWIRDKVRERREAGRSGEEGTRARAPASSAKRRSTQPMRVPQRMTSADSIMMALPRSRSPCGTSCGCAWAVARLWPTPAGRVRPSARARQSPRSGPGPDTRRQRPRVARSRSPFPVARPYAWTARPVAQAPLASPHRTGRCMRSGRDGRAPHVGQRRNVRGEPMILTTYGERVIFSC